MWNVKGTVIGLEPEVVRTSNPMAEINRFLFKDPKANITLKFGDDLVLRRAYVNGKLKTDALTTGNKLTTTELYAQELEFLEMQGRRTVYVTGLRGTTKKQRERRLQRTIARVSKDAFTS